MYFSDNELMEVILANVHSGIDLFFFQPLVPVICVVIVNKLPACSVNADSIRSWSD